MYQIVYVVTSVHLINMFSSFRPINCPADCKNTHTRASKQGMCGSEHMRSEFGKHDSRGFRERGLHTTAHNFSLKCV